MILFAVIIMEELRGHHNLSSERASAKYLILVLGPLERPTIASYILI